MKQPQLSEGQQTTLFMIGLILFLAYGLPILIGSAARWWGYWMG